MSSHPPSDGPSQGPSVPGERASGGVELSSDPSLASLVRLRGAALLDALERAAPGSREHAEGAASYAFVAAVELGFDRSHSELVRETVKLHEVGLVYLPPDLLAKPRRERSKGDQEAFASRFETGARLALGAGIPETVCRWMGYAGERFDGSGPAGLARGEIPIESRIARVACVFDTAIAEPTGDRKPQTPAERRDAALDVLRGEAGAQLDAAVVDALAAVLARAG
jgi:HD-GYP domain-containing protein (c-di-GMP phosphodiesterase class II)